MTNHHSVDLLFLACNRLEFTRETFNTLRANTDWDLVHELAVYDDGSRDGTREWLAAEVARVPVPTRFERTQFGSPVAAMVHFIETARAPILAKTDNDAMLSPGWLEQSVEVLERHPELSLLGVEAMYPHRDAARPPRTYAPAAFVSGLGLYRRQAFAASRPRPVGKWYGLEEWQTAHDAHLVRGWITPALPVFLLDRIPFPPWSTYSEGYVRRGWQRQWPKYDPACTLWHWRWPDHRPNAMSFPSGDVRFLAALRVKNEAKCIREVIVRTLSLCRRVFVFDDHSADETSALCHSFGDRVTVFESPFEGLDEARDKNYLLKKIIEAAPEWVLWIDGDEVLESTGPATLRAAADKGRGVAAYSVRIAYLWNDEHHVRVDGIYGQFTRPSFFRLAGQRLEHLRFAPTGCGGNFHCGNVPQGLAGDVRGLEVRLKHFGYMTPEQRKGKYEWYTAIDPNNAAEDHYRHLAGIAGARFAPGPPRIIPWVE